MCPVVMCFRMQDARRFDRFVDQPHVRARQLPGRLADKSITPSFSYLASLSQSFQVRVCVCRCVSVCVSVCQCVCLFGLVSVFGARLPLRGVTCAAWLVGAPECKLTLSASCLLLACLLHHDDGSLCKRKKKVLLAK